MSDADTFRRLEDPFLRYTKTDVKALASCFGGLEVACWPLVPKFAGSHPAEAVGFS